MRDVISDSLVEKFRLCTVLALSTYVVRIVLCWKRFDMEDGSD